MDAALMHALACEYARAPSPERLEAALRACLPLCAWIARRFSGRGAEYDDLYQTACLACVGALRAFDPGRGWQFTSYVTPTVAGAVRKYVRDRTAPLRTPRMLKSQAAELQKARERFAASHQREPSVREMGQALGWEPARVLEVMWAQRALIPLSLDAAGPEEASPAERLPVEEPGFDRFEWRQDLRLALDALAPLEREILALRYEQKLSQRETAARLNLSQMQISRMERRILAALRKEMNP